MALHREAGVPLRNLHMGGDEVPGGVWEGSPAAQAYLKEHGLALASTTSGSCSTAGSSRS